MSIHPITPAPYYKPQAAMRKTATPGFNRQSSDSQAPLFGSSGQSTGLRKLGKIGLLTISLLAGSPFSSKEISRHVMSQAFDIPNHVTAASQTAQAERNYIAARLALAELRMHYYQETLKLSQEFRSGKAHDKFIDFKWQVKSHEVTLLTALKQGLSPDSIQKITQPTPSQTRHLWDLLYHDDILVQQYISLMSTEAGFPERAPSGMPTLPGRTDKYSYTLSGSENVTDSLELSLALNKSFQQFKTRQRDISQRVSDSLDKLVKIRKAYLLQGPWGLIEDRPKMGLIHAENTLAINIIHETDNINRLIGKIVNNDTLLSDEARNSLKPLIRKLNQSNALRTKIDVMVSQGDPFQIPGVNNIRNIRDYIMLGSDILETAQSVLPAFTDEKIKPPPELLEDYKNYLQKGKELQEQIQSSYTRIWEWAQSQGLKPFDIYGFGFNIPISYQA